MCGKGFLVLVLVLGCTHCHPQGAGALPAMLRGRMDGFPKTLCGLASEYMEGILAINIPSKLSNSRHNLPWMNRNLKIIIRKKGRRFKKATKSGMDKDSGRNLDIEQMVKRELRDAERVYVNSILQNGLESENNKPFWKYVKSPKQ